MNKIFLQPTKANVAISVTKDPNKTQTEHVYANGCQHEVAGDVISCAFIKTVEGYALLQFEAASISSFRENQNQPFA